MFSVKQQTLHLILQLPCFQRWSKNISEISSVCSYLPCLNRQTLSAGSLVYHFSSFTMPNLITLYMLCGLFKSCFKRYLIY